MGGGLGVLGWQGSFNLIYVTLRQKTMTKIIQSGAVCEVYQDDRVEVPKRKQKRPRGFRGPTADELRAMVAKRAKKSVKRIIWANYNKKTTAFLTLTFNTDKAKEYSYASESIKKFFQRLAYRQTGRKISHYKYVCVHELQKNGRYHFHILVFNFPYMENHILEKVWGHGFVQIKRVFGNVEHCANYVVKYFSKRFQDMDLHGKKRYYRSKNLISSVVFKGEQGLEYFRNFDFLGHEEIYTFVSEELRFTYSVFYSNILPVANYKENK